ncbi:MAG: hypothetical protein FWH53_07605 [Leptospirales bacterium]|nr:hypothetical protein [Leptospirales bacterium]MCL2155511.1 hypothetical protein [Leptospirales bacterium]
MLLDIYCENDISKINKKLNDYKKAEFSDENLVAFFSNYCIIPQDYHNLYSISGSGGSTISKPNLTSILSLYLSCLPNVNIVKTGSKSKRNGKGSSDFFSDIEITFSKNDLSFINEINFIYLDIDEISPWKNNAELVKMNKSVYRHFSYYSYNEIKTKTKIHGTIYPTVKRKIINPSDNMYQVYSVCDNARIDEITCGICYLDGKVVQNSNYKYLPERINIDETNNMLLYNPDDSFWGCSLKRYFSFACQLFGLSIDERETIELFEVIVKNKLIKKKIHLLQQFCNKY